MIFAFPSLDEGFGMPVLEAMAAGVPVLTSNRSALPEVAGDAALLVDPEDGDALSKALRELAGNSELREDLARRGAGRARLFTWEKAVRATWDVYRTLLALMVRWSAVFFVYRDLQSAQEAVILRGEFDLAGGLKGPLGCSSVTSAGSSSSSSAFSSLRLKPIVASKTRKTS